MSTAKVLRCAALVATLDLMPPGAVRQSLTGELAPARRLADEPAPSGP